jgi:hypothetical protein
MHYVKCGPKGKWSGPWLTLHQAGLIAMTYDGTVHTEAEYRAAIATERPSLIGGESHE